MGSDPAVGSSLTFGDFGEPIRMPISEDLLAVIVCPACKGRLEPSPEGDALDCGACKLRYRIEDEIPVLLVSEADKLD